MSQSPQGVELPWWESTEEPPPVDLNQPEAAGPLNTETGFEWIIPVGKGVKLLNAGIRLTQKGLAHVRKFHTGARAARLGKSTFNAGEDVASLIRSGTQHPLVRQANGNFARTFDAGRNIGIDRATGAQTSIVTVITRPNGNLVTAFPGVP